MSYCIRKSSTRNPMLIGAASNRANIQITPMTIFDACFDERALSGFSIALCLSIAIAVSVNIDTLTDTIWTKGQKGHMNLGRSQRCRMAAWNWNGMEKSPMMTSAMARFPMKKLVTVCICLVVTTIHITSALPITAIKLMLPYSIDSRISRFVGTWKMVSASKWNESKMWSENWQCERDLVKAFLVLPSIIGPYNAVTFIEHPPVRLAPLPTPISS